MDRIYPHETWVHQNTASSNRRAVRSESGMLSVRKGEKLRRNVMLGKELPGMGRSQHLYLTFGDLETVKGRQKKTEVTERKTSLGPIAWSGRAPMGSPSEASWIQLSAQIPRKRGSPELG